MSTIILPARLALKPDRPILAPPFGWDDAPADRPRVRAGWWRRLLAGRAGNTRLQPGACCGCGAAPYACGTCDIPRQNLIASWDSGPGGAGSATLAYDGARTWDTGCVGPFPTGGKIEVTMTCVGTGTSVSVYGWEPSQVCGVDASFWGCGVDAVCGTPNFQLLSLTCGASFLMTFRAGTSPTTCCNGAVNDGWAGATFTISA